MIKKIFNNTLILLIISLLLSLEIYSQTIVIKHTGQRPVSGGLIYPLVITSHNIDEDFKNKYFKIFDERYTYKFFEKVEIHNSEIHNLRELLFKYIDKHKDTIAEKGKDNWSTGSFEFYFIENDTLKLNEFSIDLNASLTILEDFKFHLYGLKLKNTEQLYDEVEYIIERLTTKPYIEPVNDTVKE